MSRRRRITPIPPPIRKEILIDTYKEFKKWLDENLSDIEYLSDAIELVYAAWKAGYDFRKSQEKRTCLSGPDEWFMKRR